MADAPIPLLDVAAEVDVLYDDLMAATGRVLRSGAFILGPEVVAFEREAAAYLGTRHAVGVNSCTDALMIGLRALGVGPGDEVITTAMSVFPTAEAISAIGATPVFVDVEPVHLAIDPARVEAAVTQRTRAIVPVHLYGHAANLDALGEIAARRGLVIVEDAAHAFGGAYRGRKLGAWGAAGAFSFFPSKPLGGFGDGGLLVTDDDDVAAEARVLRAHGARRRFANEAVGYNSRLDALQAAMLRVKLACLDDWTARRARVAAAYDAKLAEVPGVSLLGRSALASHAWHLYVVRIGDGRREAVRLALQARGIEAIVHYPIPMPQLPVYGGEPGRFPVAEQAAADVLSLPFGPFLTSESQERVIKALRDALGA